MMNQAYYIHVLEEEIKALQSQIEPHDTGHLYTTINTLEHRVSELQKSLDQTSIKDFEQEYYMTIEYKYNEDQILEEIERYINSTYDGHYSKKKYQATEFIIDGGHGTGFCIGNVLKYAQRYGIKGDNEDWRKDLLKVIHYAIIQLHVHDKENT